MTNVLLIQVMDFGGRHLLKRLINLGYNVRYIVHPNSNLIDIKKLNAEFILWDVTNKVSIREYLRNIDVIFHLTGTVSV